MQAPDRAVLNIVLLGPPGAGKSTIAEALIENLNIKVISTGQLLRDQIRMRTPLGREVAQQIDQGNLAPDSVMDRMLRASLETLDPDQGILLDGYPRTMNQALGLTLMFADYGRILDQVIALDVGDAEVIRRLSGRRICEGAGDPFPIHIDDLASMLRCRERGGQAVQRDDDKPEVVQQRIEVYHAQTRPILDYYEREGLLHHVDASGNPASVARLVLEWITSNRQPAHQQA
ncbi:MAG TPA: adenylate kinase [Roseiflexaceae bacterium]|nr:adenylate kinase [Roseiflexaceae bacterium]